MKDGKKLILIADDESEIRDIISLFLGAEGYGILTAENGTEVLALAAPEVDLYILDINMPELSGLKAAAELRKHYDTPIIFLTAYSGETDKVMAFSVGADDYIVKPFSNIELLMRVRAILRRTASEGSRSVLQGTGSCGSGREGTGFPGSFGITDAETTAVDMGHRKNIEKEESNGSTGSGGRQAGEQMLQQGIITGVQEREGGRRLPFQDAVLDLDRQIVERGGEEIGLTYTEFRILELMVSNKKKIYSLENIYSSVWQEEAVGDSAVMVHIKNIRKKLKDNSRNPLYIKTAWGRGYYVD